MLSPYNFIKNTARLQSYSSTIKPDDLAGKHRFELFKTCTFFSALVLIISIFQYPYEQWRVPVTYFIFFGLFFTVIINYIVLNYTHKAAFASWYLFLVLYVLLHIVTYFLGGIKNSGSIYLLILVIYAYMLIGKKGGLTMSVIGVLHCFYFYFIAGKYFDIDFSLIKNDSGLINMDYFITALVAIVIVRSQAHYLERTQREIIKDILNTKDQVAEMELKTLRSQIHPHFTFNVMNSVQYYITHNDTDSANKYLSKFSSLIRKILDNSQATLISLEDEMQALGIYLELEKMRFEDKFEYSIVEINSIPYKRILIPSMLLQPFIENSIQHGFTGLTKKGTIEIIFEYSNSVLQCTLRDNGTGRLKSKLMDGISDNHKSMGINITTERIKKINALYKCNASIKIIDLFENDLPAGTEIRIVLPDIKM